MRKLAQLLLATAVAATACSDSSSDAPLAPAQPELNLGGSNAVQVKNTNNDGAGSFRAAVERANTTPTVTRIEFRAGLGPIVLAEPVVYTGAQALTIVGNGSTLDGSALGAADAATFVASGGGDLNVSRLTVRNAPQEGLVYQVPATATGTKKVVLTGLTVTGNRGHGVVINDQTDPIDPANAGGSDAALDVVVVGARFANNGFGVIDRDGLRINEGGLGNLNVTLSLVVSEDNGADGVELDERGDGDVSFNVSGSRFSRNGAFDLPNNTATQDLDDGMDVDESGPGSLIGKVFASAANDNYEEGWDFNENDLGDFRVDMTLAEASRNYQEGFDFEEDDDFAAGDGRVWGGDLYATLIAVKADGNGLDPRPTERGDGGIKIRERFDGNIDATIRGATTTANVTGGINIREQENGNLLAAVERATATGNGTEGIYFREQNAGDLTATVTNSTSANNLAAGIRANQQTAGVGALNLIGVTYSGNLAPEILLTNTVLTETP